MICTKCGEKLQNARHVAGECRKGGDHDWRRQTAFEVLGIEQLDTEDRERVLTTRRSASLFSSAHSVVYGLRCLGDEHGWAHTCVHPMKVLGLAIWVPVPSVVTEVWCGAERLECNVDTRFFGLCLSFEELRPLVERGVLPSSLVSWRMMQAPGLFHVTLRDKRPAATMAIWGKELRD